MVTAVARYVYPRRRVLRWALQRAAWAAFGLLTDLNVIGRENLPKSGPLLVVANHFSFVDPALMVRVAPWPLEFVGGFRMPNAPALATLIPKLWGFYAVHRGAASMEALRAGEAVLTQGGVLGIYPEAGSWATVLRPARPGAAFLAARTGVPILPMGFDGVPNILPRLVRGERAPVTVRIGRPFGPFRATGRGRERREQLERIGHEIMGRIAELLPVEKRGRYSPDPGVREAARAFEAYPWDDAPEV